MSKGSPPGLEAPDELMEHAASRTALEAELADARLLQALSTELIRENDVQGLYEKIMDAAASIMRSQFASLQILYPERGQPGGGGELKLLAFRGFDRQAAEKWLWVRADDQSTCGAALRSGRRCIVPDVESCDFMTGTLDLATYLHTGIRAVQSTPLFAREGKLVGMISTHWSQPHEPSERDLRLLDIVARQAADLIERNQTVQALRESERKYHTLFDSMDEGYILVDVMFDEAGRPVDMLYLEANAAAVQMGGMDPTGRRASELVPDFEPHWFETFGRVARSGAGERHEYYAAALGSWYDFYVFKIGDPDGTRVAAVYQDVTERRKADRQKDEFLAMLAHELRNPLAPIRNALSIMRLADNDPEGVRLASLVMERQVAQLVHLVDDLLDVSRISRGRIELRRERIELAPVLLRALETVRPTCESMGHELTLALPAAPVCLDGDSTRLTQVFANLLDNACKYMDKGGAIRLSLEVQEAGQERGGEAVVRVKDGGIGIPADQLARIFSMFAQVDTSLERAQSGLGIGLTLVKSLVEMHGGRVHAFSGGLGEGSEFVVQLPVLAEAAPPPRMEPAAMEGAAACRILVVDDNRDSAETLAQLLDLTGHETHTVFDGVQALEAAEALRPDVVLLDLGMPKLNGYEVCRRIRAQPWGRDMALIAQTGWGQDEDKRLTREAGFDAHLVKPLSHAALSALLDALLPAGKVRAARPEEAEAGDA